MNAKVLILPGIGNSGPGHWQSLWETSNPLFRRVVQRDWDNPICSEWMTVLERAVSDAGPHTVLVAHSLACLLVSHWATSSALSVLSALLVAVPDPDGPFFPKEAIGFSSLPEKPLPFQSIVVASTDDLYGSLEYANRCASVWGSRFVTIGAAGHINADSGLGEWREGFALLKSLLA